MDKEKLKWIIYALIGFIFLFNFKYTQLVEERDDLEDELSSYEDKLSNYQEALDHANSNIEDAKWSAWSSYEDMGYALDNLETVEP